MEYNDWEEILMRWSKKLLIAVLAAAAMLLTMPAMADTLRFGAVDGTGSVNLREQATTSSRRLGSYEAGTWMRITGESGNWYKVVAPDGRSGWMSKNYVLVTAAAKGTIGIVDVSSALNLRKNPSSSARSLGTYLDGTPCILLSETGDWYHVTVDGTAGYFSSAYIDKKYMAYSPDVATVISTNGGAVNMRKGPGTQYGVLKSVKHGGYVMILQKGDGWWKVTCDGSIGYMDTDFLKDGIHRVTAVTGGTSSGSSSSGSTGSSGSSSSSATYALVNCSSKLHLRQAATSDSLSLGKYPRGTQVLVLSEGRYWCKVRVDGKTGYMATEYLKFTTVATMTVDHPDGTFVNLRSGAGLNYSVLVRVPHGSVVSVITRGSTWTKVSYGGRVGYMMTRYLED